jgi:hypothetical protein
MSVTNVTTWNHQSRSSRVNASSEYVGKSIQVSLVLVDATVSLFNIFSARPKKYSTRPKKYSIFYRPGRKMSNQAKKKHSTNRHMISQVWHHKRYDMESPVALFSG